MILAIARCSGEQIHSLGGATFHSRSRALHRRIRCIRLLCHHIEHGINRVLGHLAVRGQFAAGDGDHAGVADDDLVSSR
ncbi:MAG: hypothetical protein ACKOAT_13100 [Actinomycetota bacterium]